MASFSITLVFFGASLLLVAALASEKGEVPKFNYLESEKWGAIDPKFAACSKGKRQSPIDIKTTEVVLDKNLQPLTRKYHVFNTSLQTDGLDVEVKFNVRGGLIIDGKTYNLKQMHWHTPSEHRLNGVQYAAELHQVHVADDGSRAVIAILLQEGPPSPVLTTLKPQLDELAMKPCEGEQVVIPKFDSRFLKKRPRHYYRYLGSLTTPPCDENVIWNVLAKVKTISKEQVAALKAPACTPNKKNARPIQQLNGRTVQKYEGN